MRMLRGSELQSGRDIVRCDGEGNSIRRLCAQRAQLLRTQLSWLLLLGVNWLLERVTELPSHSAGGDAIELVLIA